MTRLGALGIWSRELRFGDPVEALEAAAELDGLGYGALWVPDIGGPVLETVSRLLAAAPRVTIATGILNVWMHDGREVAADLERIERDHPGRFVLGLGIGHAPIVDADEPGRYRQPLTKMRSYLDELDEHATRGAARPPRLLAALRPKMLELAAERAAGAHPYLVPVEHTARARAALGPGRTVAPELTVVLEADPERARLAAREDLQLYLGLPNYTGCWRGLGFGDEDLAAGGSDRLVDALYAWGPLESIAQRVREHRDAGADHLCLRVVNATDSLPRAAWRELAGLLSG